MERSAVRLSGTLLLGGFLLNAVVTMLFHPGGAEDDHPAIFTEYAQSGPWVAVHLAQFVLVLVVLGGLLVLSRALRDEAPHSSRFAAAGAIATAATWAVLQAVDGVALKQAVDAWVDASPTEEAIRFATAETVRWVEWGLQSYFRVLLGATFLFSGTAIVASRLVASWLGWVAVLAGLLSLAIGVDVGDSGLESGFQDAIGIVFQLVALVFVVGLLTSGPRRRDPPTAARG